MTRTVRTLVAVDPGLDVGAITSIVPDGDGLQVVGVVADLEDARRRLEQVQYDTLVVASTTFSEPALRLVSEARRHGPERSVLVLSEATTNGYVRRLIEAGADDILMLPQSREQVAFAIRKIRALKDTESEGAENARLIVVLGPKGGTGKTLISTNLGAALATEGFETTIVDIDLQFGDVALTMGLPPETTIHDLAQRGGSLDADALAHFLVRDTSGVRALLAPSRPDQASAVSVDLIRDIYAHLRTMNDYVIVDTPPGFTAEVIASIDAATDLIMVGMLDSLSLKNTKLGLETLKLMGHDDDDIKLVLNRAHSRVGISHSDVVAILGREPDIYVPSDREIPRAVNEGVPIVISKPESEAAQAFRTLAGLYSGVPASSGAAGRWKLFGRRP